MKKIVMLLLLPKLFLACSVDEIPTFSFETLPVANVLSVPDTFVVGEIASIDISYLRPSTCHSFEGIQLEPETTTNINIAVLARLVEGRAPCTDLSNEEVTVPIAFNPLEPGEVTLNFLTGTDAEGQPTFITFNVPVIE